MDLSMGSQLQCKSQRFFINIHENKCLRGTHFLGSLSKPFRCIDSVKP